jgi:hypothetical protein
MMPLSGRGGNGGAAYAHASTWPSVPHPPSAELVSLHKLALRFADNPEYQVHLARGGVHERLLELMRLYEYNTFVQSAGVYCVGMLAVMEGNRPLLASHNAVECVLLSMERFPTMQHFQQSGITALRNMAEFIGFNPSRAARAICAAMEQVPASRGAARARLDSMT